MDRDHPQYHYTQVAAQQASRIHVQPSTTGNEPVAAAAAAAAAASGSGGSRGAAPSSPPQVRNAGPSVPPTAMRRQDSANQIIEEKAEGHDNDSDSMPEFDEKGGRNIYGLNDEPYHDHAVAGGYDTEYRQDAYGYGPTNMQEQVVSSSVPLTSKEGGPTSPTTPGVAPLRPKESNFSLWQYYCHVVTFWAPPPVLRLFGMRTKDRQRAWREKIGLITVILYVGAFVAYLTFGFTNSVCHNTVTRIRNNEVATNYLIINGRIYDLSSSRHPAAAGIQQNSNILYPPINAGGMDASFLFQNVNGHCKDLITPKANCSIPHNDNEVAWYMPCRLFAQNGTTQPNFTVEHYEGWACHTQASARESYYNLKEFGEVYFTWNDIKNETRNLVVYNGNVIDLDLISWIQTSDLDYPDEFNEMRDGGNLRGLDVSQIMAQGKNRQMMNCLSEIAKVGYVDTEAIGCIASQVVLYISLVFIIGLVGVKFVFACYFRWFLAPRQGAFYMSRKDMDRHENQIEDWSEDIYSQAPIGQPRAQNPARAASGGIAGSRFKRADDPRTRSITMMSQIPEATMSKVAGPLNGPGMRTSSYGTSIYNGSIPPSPDPYRRQHSLVSQDISYRGAMLDDDPYGASEYPPAPNEYYDVEGPVGSNTDYLVPQPPIDYQPFGYPLAHTVCLVTAYSESVEGLRTTLDSIATTDYPNSHKLLFVVCDGIVKGSGNDMSTPDIAISMMKDFAEPPEEVMAYSYVSVVAGSKRHNMAKVYAGFYSYDDATIDPSKQQRVPMITIVKCGTPAEVGAAKPGNRGKRDSQCIFMSFFQRVMFDERMTELEYEIFNGIWRVAGVAPDFYETVLMVDADTKVYPDSLTHMVAAMVKDPEIMGLCGETKIANKSESWVSMIQVFEYFIAHNQTKAFESVFGGVTCLPGCFSMYRIKTPKGPDGYWVPILANPDIVERYSDNVVDTLHKKNLLLLGEDRYLSTLMLRTFPKRKQVFVPKAACKTIVPSSFRVLLSQRRRWINSTVHNLMELVLVRDLCGVFCISMQFVVFVDLVSTLVLPAAIAFTFYVVIFAIVSSPTPTMSLILLGLILGLPGVLIIVTATRASYVLWMGIYLLSLPIWNFVLPMYAYWKFDDFSWGDTRKLAGNVKGGHDDAAGEFDSSQIVMKRWRDFQRERNKRLTVAPRSTGWASDADPSLLSSGHAGGSSASGHSRSPRSEAHSSSGSSIHQHPSVEEEGTNPL